MRLQWLLLAQQNAEVAGAVVMLGLTLAVVGCLITVATEARPGDDRTQQILEAYGENK